MSLETEGISDWGIMIHLFFLHLPTQKRCWSFFISLGRKAREGLDSIFQGEHARCIPHILLASSSEVVSSLSRPRPASLDQPQPASKKHTHKSYIIIPGKTPLTQDCSFSGMGTRSREFPIFSASYRKAQNWGKRIVFLKKCFWERFYITIVLVVSRKQQSSTDKFNLARQMAKA